MHDSLIVNTKEDYEQKVSQINIPKLVVLEYCLLF